MDSNLAYEIYVSSGWNLIDWTRKTDCTLDDLNDRMEALEKAIKAIREAPLVAAGKLPPPLPKR